MKIKGFNIIKTSQVAYNACYFIVMGDPIEVPGIGKCHKGPSPIVLFQGEELCELFPGEITPESIAEDKMKFNLDLKCPGLRIGDDVLVVSLTLTPEQIENSYELIHAILPTFDKTNL